MYEGIQINATFEELETIKQNIYDVYNLLHLSAPNRIVSEEGCNKRDDCHSMHNIHFLFYLYS